MLKVGDIVKKRISCSCTSGLNGFMQEEMVRRTGTVVYVHPKGRFYVVEFAFPDGKIRECYREVKADDSEKLSATD